MRPEEKIQKLVSFRDTNIKNMLSDWSDEDFTDMRNAFHTAKEIALEKGNDLSVKLNNEKLSQLEEAWILKSKTQKQPTYSDKSIDQSPQLSL